MGDYLRGRKATYDLRPKIQVHAPGARALRGYEAIVDELRSALAGRGPRPLLVIDCYHGVDLDELAERIVAPLAPSVSIRSDSARRPEQDIAAEIGRFLTKDRVFGRMAGLELGEFFDPELEASLRRRLDGRGAGLAVVYGVGASRLARGDLLVYADMTRWEIQRRFRSGSLDNWGAGNHGEDPLRMFKRGYFVEWRAMDRHKLPLLERADYILDTVAPGDPRMLDGESFREGLHEASGRPFRLVPYFDPGIWGGQWMKEICGLDRSPPNYAWCFDCVPEENALILEAGGVELEAPALDLVLREPRRLLGERVHARFGAEFPIRFDFLDTMGGGNLSLQVHPLTEYIQDRFGMHYTQDESYYILDAGEDASVFLGLKAPVDRAGMMAALRRAQAETEPFPVERYVNRFPARKHDHFLIPAGTVHCSGRNAMVLEISATPYIFTFKLWDWGRVGLDGRPRPTHIDHGERVIQFDRDTGWTERELVGRVERVASGEGWIEERTGLHSREFIETRRHWFSAPVLHRCDDSVHVLNLVEGEEATVESPSGAFEPFLVHYAETFIVPAAVNEYVVRPSGPSEGRRIATIRASVR